MTFCTRRVWRNKVCAAGRLLAPWQCPRSRPYLWIWTLPASSPGNEHRAPATSVIPPNPPRTRRLSAEHRRAVAPTQDALYRDLELDLSWSERDLPERERTKHVHRLHPYLGKFIPQLVEVLLGRYFVTGQHVLDPFAGSGTTLVQALESGLDATGADIAAFNCLLMEVKTRRYNPFVLERELRAACERIGETSTERPRGYLRAWFAPQAARELLGFRGLVDDYVNADVLRVALGRAARSARRTKHFDLDFPREPQREEYWCHKHKRTCRPVGEAAPFLRRYALDTLERIKAFSRVRARAREAVVLHGDARELDFGGPFDGVVTSPPYPGAASSRSGPGRPGRRARRSRRIRTESSRPFGTCVAHCGRTPRW
ncbi:MAG: site-specific DNA-methyltransferase [Actinobacteria bacterium]|nr:MAG: site-specific DNA-methyltransferase [Actinomycetota bacterium]